MTEFSSSPGSKNTHSHFQCQWRGGYFAFSAKIGLKSAKNEVFCILCMPMGLAILPCLLFGD